MMSRYDMLFLLANFRNRADIPLAASAREIGVRCGPPRSYQLLSLTDTVSIYGYAAKAAATYTLYSFTSQYAHRYVLYSSRAGHITYKPGRLARVTHTARWQPELGGSPAPRRQGQCHWARPKTDEGQIIVASLVERESQAHLSSVIRAALVAPRRPKRGRP